MRAAMVEHYDVDAMVDITDIEDDPEPEVDPERPEVRAEGRPVMADQYNAGSPLASMDTILAATQSELERISRSSAPYSADYLAWMISDADLLMHTLSHYRLSLVRLNHTATVNEAEHRSTPS